MSRWQHHLAILIVYPLLGAGGIIAILWIVGETVEHFTPELSLHAK